jgi:DNA-binding transcriptional regulator YiaG
MDKKHGRYRYRESGLDNVWLKDWPMFVCRKCRIKMPLISDEEQMAKEIIPRLLRTKARLNGDSIVYLRKALGLKTGELARRLQVHRGTVSRWENDKHTIDREYDLQLRLLVKDQIFPENRDLREDILRALPGLVSQPASPLVRPSMPPIVVPAEASSNEMPISGSVIANNDV